MARDKKGLEELTVVIDRLPSQQKIKIIRQDYILTICTFLPSMTNTKVYFVYYSPLSLKVDRY